MRKILDYLDLMEDELSGAKEYSEKYIECRASGNVTWAERFKEMSIDKLKILEWLYELTISEIEQIKKVYTPPYEVQEVWDNKCKKYIEKSALIKQMLSI